MSLTKESAMNIVRRRKPITSSGKFRAKITNAPQYFNGISDGRDPVPARFIVGTDLIAPDQLDKLKANVAIAVEGEAAGATIDWTDVIKQSNLSHAFLMNLDGSEPDWMPTKGEFVEVFVDLVNGPGDDSTNQVYRIQSMNPIKASTITASLDVATLFGEEVPAEDKKSALSESRTTARKAGAKA